MPDYQSTCKAAREVGDKFYLTGKPCKHGHLSLRYVSGGCVECTHLKGITNEARAYQTNYRQSLHGKYIRHKHHAEERNHRMLMSFEEWLKVGNDSGKLHLRGNKRGKYVMSRFNDRGDYSIDNVHIQLFEYNIAEWNVTRHLP
jgi:hypothetical protein